jgi:heme oxygenase
MHRLKEHTHALHAQVEQSLDFNASLASKETYVRLLSRFFGFYAPLERRLEAVSELDATGLDWNIRRKVPSLIADLSALGHSSAEIGNLPLCAELPEITSLAQALGTLYVVEGSTLGGQLISREVQKRLGLTSCTGGSFFAGYGDQTRDRWREFCFICDQFSDRCPEADECLLAAAARSFICIQHWIAP